MSEVIKQIVSTIKRDIWQISWGSWNGWTVQYESNFSAGSSGMSAVNGVVAGNIDGIGGRNDVLRYYANATNSQHSILNGNNVTAGQRTLMLADIFIPSGNANLNGILFSSRQAGNDKSFPIVPLGEWFQIYHEFIPDSTGASRFYTLKDGGINWVGANLATDDLIYIHNVKLIKVS